MLRFSNDLQAYAVGRRVNSEEWNARTFTMAAASAATRLGFGVPVMPGNGRNTCVELDATTGRVFLGVTEAVPTLPRPGDDPTLGGAFARYDEVPVDEIAVLAVKVIGNTTKNAVARWDTVAKAWTAAAQSATVVTLPGVTFEETATAPGISPIRIRRPNPALSVSG